MLGTFKEKAKSFYLQCERVWHLLRKPTNQEFWTIGAVGFLIADIIKVFLK
jgi:preprotein translocase subunit Sss1